MSAAPAPRVGSADAAALLVPLTDGTMRLEPLAEHHREPLRAACAADPAIWEIYMASFLGEHFDGSFDAYLGKPARLMFALVDGAALIGMSGYLNIDPAHHVLEIGSTYLAPSARGTDRNRRCKALLIGHAIASGFDRIEFRIDTRNARSMRAVEKLGSRLEGIMRRHRITWTGYRRDTALYALFAEDWCG